MTDQTPPPQQRIDALLDEANACLYSETAHSFDLAQEAFGLATHHAYNVGETRSLRQMASCYMVRGEPAEAMPYAITSLTLALENDLPCEGAHAYLTIGTLQNMGGNYSLAAETYMDGLELANACDNPTLMTLFHHHLAEVYYNFSDYDWQIYHLEQALNFADQADDPPKRRAFALAALGSAYLGKDDYTRALLPLTEVLNYAENEDIWYLQASTLNTLGQVYLGLANFDEADKHLQHALELAEHHKLSQWIITAWINLADLHIARGEYEPALNFLREGLDQAQKYERGGQEQDIHKRLAETHEHFGNYQRALDHFRRYHTLHRQEHDRDTQTRIQVMKMKFALDDARREVEFQRLRNTSLQHQLRERERTEAERLEREKLRIALEEKQKTEALNARILEQITHKFRTPLTAINSSANLLARYHDRLTDEKRENHQRIINDSVTRLNTMLGDILDILRRDPGPLLVDPHSITLGDICQEAILSAEAATRKLDRIQLQLKCDSVTIRTSTPRLTTIITHLLTNALKFSDDPVELTIATQNGRLTITVTDTGIGILPDEQVKIFEPFFRGSNLAPDFQGSGLGLTIVQGDVMNLGGEIALRS
ncbi:MAG: tetratricopeptide repeat protein, partial [Anaerolineae bacterium]|nr:tetratricopeptide repeat protein [Anaerolineae bacterium]